jgi:hypothetical protein
MFTKFIAVVVLSAAANVWANEALIVRQNVDSGCIIYSDSVYFTYQGEEVGARYFLLFTKDIQSVADLKTASAQSLKEFTDLNCQGE